ncbi:MAG: phenylalanine--tRNA ligase subunit beta [Desulfurococcaceae archaeon]
MPTIKASVSYLKRLTGLGLDAEILMRLLPTLKCEIERLEGDELEYEASHDRPDLFSAEGLARSMLMLLGRYTKRAKVVDLGALARAEEVPYRPYVAFGVVSEIKLDDESIRQLTQLQEKFHSTYGRDRRKISIGFYDLDKIKLPVTYRLARPDEIKFVPLDHEREMSLAEVLEKTEQGRKYGHLVAGHGLYPVIVDAEGRVVGFPPIVNSEETRVTERTRALLIDSTGLDQEWVVNAVTLIAYNALETASEGTLGVVETKYWNGTSLKAPRTAGRVIAVNVKEVNALLGTEISGDEMVRLAELHGYEAVSRNGDVVLLRSPPFRFDVKEWVDVAEDVAMSYGYHRLGAEALSLPSSRSRGIPLGINELSNRLADSLVGLGFTEVATYMMSNREWQFELFNVEGRMFEVSNPRSARYTGLRTWLTPGLLEVVKENAEREAVVRIFEVGDVAIPCEEAQVCVERRVGIAISHEKATITDALAVIRGLLEQFGLRPKFERARVAGMLEERGALIIVEGRQVGFAGEVHPLALERVGLSKPVAVAELVVDRILPLLR